MDFFKIVFEALWLGAVDLVESTTADAIATGRGVLAAFPNVFKMMDLLLRFGTSLTGRAIAVPLRGIGEVLITRLTVLRLHNRLLRLDDAVRMFTRGPEEFIQQITLTDEAGLIEWLLTTIGRRLWRTFKSFRFLLKLMRVKDEIELVTLIVTKYKKRALFYWWIAIVVGGLMLVVSLATYISVAMTAMVFVLGLEEKYLLPQDSRRTWRKGGAVRRVNVRRGPDLEPA